MSTVGRILSFQRSGSLIETLGVHFSGRISVHDFSGDYQLWRIRSGMVYSGQGRPFRATPSRLLLVFVRGESAKVIDDVKPGKFWRKKRQELSEKMRILAGVECEVCGAIDDKHDRAAHSEYNALWCSK